MISKIEWQKMSIEKEVVFEKSINILHEHTNLQDIFAINESDKDKFKMEKKKKNKIKKKVQPESQYVLIQETDNGKMYYKGAKLYSEDEDILLALLANIDNDTQKLILKMENLPENIFINCSIQKSSLIKMIYGKSDKFYLMNKEIVENRLEQMHLACFKFIFKDGMILTSHIFGNIVQLNEEFLFIEINSLFYREIFNRVVTYKELQKRCNINNYLAKNLYSFMQNNHDSVLEIPLLDLANFLQMDINKPNHQIWNELRKSIDEQVKQNILTSQSRKDANDIVKLVRVTGTE